MKKILTVLFDGFGYREDDKGNAIKVSDMKNYTAFFNKYPHTTLYASEERIGLLPGQLGGSEIGHMTIGAGRLIKSAKIRIREFLEDPGRNSTYQNLISNPNRTVHLMGLCSDKNIHAGIDDCISMYNLLIKNGFTNIYFHLITDGRDTKVNVAYQYISQIENLINKTGIGSIATICGRYYAMDRNANYDRTKLYYDLVTKGVGTKILNIEPMLNSSYGKGITDEFIKPTIINHAGLITDDDILIWLNFRTDRAKQILECFTNKKYDKFEVQDIEGLDVYTFVKIDKNIKTNCFLDEAPIENSLGQYFSKLGIKQARIAETEKFPHVTYFLDAGYDGKIENCDKFHVQSPDVATYDQFPEMNAFGVTKKAIECMDKDYDFIFVNFANPDMVGHTGNFDATVKACNFLDMCLGKIIEAAEDNFYTIIFLADHGNADQMLNDDGSINTAHSLSKVPFIIGDEKIKLNDDGDLTNVAPTILDYMNISIPSEMSADSLLEDK